MKTLSIIISIFFTIFIILFIFTFLTVEKLHAETIITDADITYHEYTILTDYEDALINSMAVTYHDEWSDEVTMTAHVN